MLDKNSSRWLPWVMLVGLPLLFWPDATDPYGTIRWAAMSGVAIYIWGRGWGRWREWIAAVDSPVRWAILAFHLTGVVSMAAALHPLEALWDILRWLMVSGMVVGLAGVLRDNPSAKQQVGRASSVAGLLLAAIRLLQMAEVLGGIPEGGDPLAATLGNPNFFGGTMAMLACGGAASLLSEKQTWRWIGLGAALASAVMVWQSNSTGALLALGAGVIALAEGGIRSKWPGSVYARLGWIRFALLGVALTGLAIGFVAVLQKAPAELQPGASSELERVLMWRKSVEMIGDAPIVGVGPGHWHYHILRLGAVSNFQGFATRYFMDAHNDYLQVTAERGFLGGIAFIAMVLGIWKGTWRRRSPKDGESSLSGADVLHRLSARMVLTVWMVFALTNMPGNQAYLTAVWIVFGALMLSNSYETAAKDASKGSPKGLKGWGWMGIAFLAGAVGTLLLQGLWMKADRINFKMLLAKGNMDWPKTQRLAKDAQAWYNPHDRVAGMPIVWYEGASQLAMGQVQTALPLLQAAKEAHPYHPHVSSNLGVAYFMDRKYEKAIAELEDLMARFPDFNEARRNLCEAYLTVGERDKAAKTIDYWRLHTGNPEFDGYYAKIMALLQAPAAP